MGNQNEFGKIGDINKKERVFFPNYSNSLENDNNNPSNSNKNPKQIDKEHVTISKIFKITLDEKEKDKFTFLELYLAQLMSMNKECKFRINDLDEIILGLFPLKENILEYLFDIYHRSIEMIEKRFRNEYDEKYKKIHGYISNYICMLMIAPENLGKIIPKEQIIKIFNKYFTDIDIDELGYILFDFYTSTYNNYNNLKEIFKYYFHYLDESNRLNCKNYYGNKDFQVKNMEILSSLFKTCPLTSKAFVEISLSSSEENLTLNILGLSETGLAFQKENLISKYIDISPIEGDIADMRKYININRAIENEKVIDNQIHKLNDYLNKVTEFLVTIYYTDYEHTIMKWIYKLIRINLDKIKIYKEENKLSSNGFLLNILMILMKIFFRDLEKGEQNEKTYSEYIFKVVGSIDTLFSLTNDKIDFSKIERTNPNVVQLILQDDNYKNDFPEKFSIYSELFFIIQMIVTYTIKSFTNQITQLNKMTEELLKKNNNNIRGNQQLQNMIILDNILLIYLKNQELYKCLLRFCEVTTFLIFSLNNKKYSQNEFSQNYKNVNYKEFLDDFYYHINFNDNFTISYLPENIYHNIITISLFIRNYSGDSLIQHLYCTKAIIYFSLIFSCHSNLIQNPHFRMEIFDIMIYFFLSSPKEKTSKINQIFKLLSEKFIKESLMVSILRVFIDAERLGTSNQFYEKFTVRQKILFLIDNINKGYGQLFVENIKAYTEKHNEESTKMINLLMNDLTYLNDECIENLTIIKKYQDLIFDAEKYNKLSEENKKFEEDKFKEKDRIVKAEIKLFNASLKFLVSITNILQDNFVKSGLIERLANLLNYSLNKFVTSRGNDLKVKNLSEYEFNPKFILASILTVYSAFENKKQFLEFIVKDERSYRYENFFKAKKIVEEKGQIPIDGIAFEKYNKLINKLKSIEEEIKSQELNFDDAPSEFFDPITTLIMTDPVLLPVSKVIVDRKTIEQHLLSDQNDPFNRTKLTKDMLVPCKDLKNKIDNYLKKKKNEKKKK